MKFADANSYLKRIGQNMELPSVYKTFFALKPLYIRLECKAVLGILTLCSLLAMSSLTQAQTYSLATLKSDVAKFLTNEYGDKGRVQINVGNLDQRLRLHHCPQEPS